MSGLKTTDLTWPACPWLEPRRSGECFGFITSNLQVQPDPMSSGCTIPNFLSLEILKVCEVRLDLVGAPQTLHGIGRYTPWLQPLCGRTIGPDLAEV